MIVVEHEEVKIHVVCNTPIYTEVGETVTLKDETSRQNGHLLKISAISEVKIFYQERLGLRSMEAK